MWKSMLKPLSLNLTLSLGLMISLAFTQVSHADTLRVTTNTVIPAGDEDANNCSDQGGGLRLCENFQDALAYTTDVAGDHRIEFEIPGGAATFDLTQHIPISPAAGTNLEIDGGSQITFNGGEVTRIFRIASGTELSFIGLSFENGLSTGSGGCLLANNLETTHITLRQTHWRNCQSDSDGGAVAIFSALSNFVQLNIEESLFENNAADLNMADGGNGGAVFVDALTSNVGIVSSQFRGNSAENGGAIATTTDVTVGIFASTIGPDNSATNLGNALASSDGMVSLLNVTISGHGMGSGTSDVDLDNATIGLNWNHVTMEPGTRIRVDSAASLNIGNSMVGLCEGAGSVMSDGNNLSLDESCVNDLVVADFVLGPLADNGGSTPTHLPLEGSPAIDAAVGSDILEDQRRVTRPLDGLEDGDLVADIGAVEVNPTQDFSPETSGGSGGSNSGGGCHLGTTATSSLSWLWMAFLGLPLFLRRRAI